MVLEEYTRIIDMVVQLFGSLVFVVKKTMRFLLPSHHLDLDANLTNYVPIDRLFLVHNDGS